MFDVLLRNEVGWNVYDPTQIRSVVAAREPVHLPLTEDVRHIEAKDLEKLRSALRGGFMAANLSSTMRGLELLPRTVVVGLCPSVVTLLDYAKEQQLSSAVAELSWSHGTLCQHLNCCFAISKLDAFVGAERDALTRFFLRTNGHTQL